MSTSNVLHARLLEVDSSRFDDVISFFEAEARDGVADRSNWELNYAIENQSFFCVTLEDTDEIIAVSGIWAYPHVNSSDWTAKDPQTLDLDIPRAHELGGSLVAKRFQGFSLQKVFLSARMAFVRYYIIGNSDGNTSDTLGNISIAVTKKEQEGKRSLRNIEAIGFSQTDDVSKIHCDLYYLCLNGCDDEKLAKLKRTKSCPCYNFYTATFDDYLAQSWVFSKSQNWFLTRQKTYRRSNGEMGESDSTRLLLKNDTGLYENISKIPDIF